MLVTAHQDRFIHVWNLRECFSKNDWAPKSILESPLKFATTSIEVFGDGRGFVVGSIEGRCGVKNYDFMKTGLGSDTVFCFKCHRTDFQSDKKAEVYPVNGFSFNTEYNTFMSYGGDGTFAIWNKDTKSKYKSSDKLPSPIVAASFSDDGSMLAFATGDDYERGFEERKRTNFVNQIIIRTNDVKNEVFKSRR